MYISAFLLSLWVSKSLFIYILITGQLTKCFAYELDNELKEAKLKIDTTLTFVFQARDLDANSVLEYSIIAGNDDDLFRVDSRTGTITTKQVLDFEKKQAYDLLVQVSDGFNVSRSEMHVKISLWPVIIGLSMLSSFYVCLICDMLYRAFNFLSNINMLRQKLPIRLF